MKLKVNLLLAMLIIFVFNIPPAIAGECDTIITIQYGGGGSTPDPIPDPANCELSLDADPFVNGTELHIQNGDTEIPANGTIVWKAQLEMRKFDNAISGC